MSSLGPNSEGFRSALQQMLNIIPTEIPLVTISKALHRLREKLNQTAAFVNTPNEQAFVDFQLFTEFDEVKYELSGFSVCSLGSNSNLRQKIKGESSRIMTQMNLREIGSYMYSSNDTEKKNYEKKIQELQELLNEANNRLLENQRNNQIAAANKPILEEIHLEIEERKVNMSINSNFDVKESAIITRINETKLVEKPLHEVRNQNKELTIAIGQKEILIASLNVEASTYFNKLKDAESKIQKLQKELKDIRIDYQQVLANIKELMTNVEKMKEQNVMLKNELGKKDDQINLQLIRSTIKSKHLELVNEKTKEVTNENLKLKEELAEKDSKMGKLMSDMDEEEKALSQSVVKLNRNKDNLNVKLEECKKLYEDRITEAEQIINTLANENTTISTKNEKMRKEKKMLEPMLICPLTQDVFTYPVLAEDGYIYEERAIREWFSRSRKNGKVISPTTNEPINDTLQRVYTLMSLNQAISLSV